MEQRGQEQRRRASWKLNRRITGGRRSLSHPKIKPTPAEYGAYRAHQQYTDEEKGEILEAGKRGGLPGECHHAWRPPQSCCERTRLRQETRMSRGLASKGARSSRSGSEASGFGVAWGACARMGGCWRPWTTT
eukprot:528949-Prymnesium_polylepis.2